MVAQLKDHAPWRRPGCDQRCIRQWVIRPGLLGRDAIEIHDPDAHEWYGRLLADVEGGRLPRVETGRLVVDLPRALVELDGCPLHLSPNELRLIMHLARHFDLITSYRATLEAMFGDQWAVADSFDERHYLRVVLANLRAKLGGAGGLILTIRQSGYRLQRVPVVEHVRTDQPARRAEATGGGGS